MSERKPANPDHAPHMHEEENEDDKPLVRPTTRKDPLEEGRDQAMDDAQRWILLCVHRNSAGPCAVWLSRSRSPFFGERSWFAMDGSDTSSTLRGRPCELWWTQHVELYVGTFLSCVVLWWSCFGRIALSCHFALDLLCDTAELYNSPFVRLAFAAALPVVRASVGFEIARWSIVSLSWIFENQFWHLFLLLVSGQVFVMTNTDVSSCPDYRPWDLSEDLLEYIWSSDEQRVSVLIGNHQQIGVAQTKRVSVPNGTQLIGTAQSDEARKATAWQSPFSWQWRMSTSPTRTFTRASVTTIMTSVCDGRPSFRHFCHLSFVVLFWCEWS